MQIFEPTVMANNLTAPHTVLFLSDQLQPHFYTQHNYVKYIPEYKHPFIASSPGRVDSK